MIDPIEELKNALPNLNASRNAAYRYRSQGKHDLARYYDELGTRWYERVNALAAEINTEVYTLANGTITAAVFRKGSQ